ncbi:hypothetical protein SESBI_48737, partial [Sesbania bispinosa]
LSHDGNFIEDGVKDGGVACCYCERSSTREWKCKRDKKHRKAWKRRRDKRHTKDWKRTI